MSAHGQKSQANVPITATGCLERDGKLIGSLHPQAPFSGGIESVVEALLPYHALAKDVVLDCDYEYSTALTGEREKYKRRSDNLHESKGHASVRRILGSRHDVWEAGVAKRISRLRRRLGKMASRVKDLENRKVEDKMCEMILHVNDASVACYSLLAKEREVAARARAAAMAEEQARRQALELERKKKLEEEKAASVKVEEGTKISLKPKGSIKLKLVSSKPQGGVPLQSAPVASEGKAVSGVTSHYESMHSGSDAEEADTVPPHTDKSDAPPQNNNASNGGAAAQQSGKFKLYAMLNKKL